MSRRRREKQEQEVQELRPKQSPAMFLFFWLAVPMILMIMYALYLTRQ